MNTAPSLTALLRQGAEEAIYPGAQACVLAEGNLVYKGQGGSANDQTIYDLASLTKVIATTACFMALWAKGKIGPETPIARAFPDSPAAAAGVTVADLLYHRSGLPASVAYFARVMPAVPELFDPRCPASVREDIRQAVIESAARTGLVKPPGQEAVYSDVGFILLGEALSQAAKEPLDVLFETSVAQPLQLDIHFRRLSRLPPENSAIAPTGTRRPREPQNFPTHSSPAGEVDDDNAWVMDGVAGHAGLFGRAQDVARFGQRVLEEYEGAEKLAPAALWRRALRPDTCVPNSVRAMGFDTPSALGSSAGKYFGRTQGAVGHLGFTGVSLWVDLGRKVVVALCTNRTFLGRDEVRIREFRPRFHDAVMEWLGFGGVR